ncbi:FkbM family methyltransferase [uncultured Desulfovibrio sp.]|uniref:FkbM family methyltransferase n=1 Tax=Candidatus Desulfovibrio intestinavium TaxID=2838534 RepID=A0A9D2HMY2_9BACT|nr:FkbM family methyltransferase [uncultured Desulfovibrio sp.]HJA79646.1 FkbM family methyltransferase [Candidatus Desulfovibrio intestinavium]
MSFAFQKRLQDGIRERLSSRKYRYVDNSLAYYSRPCEENMRADKEWFAHFRHLDARDFMAANARDIALQITTKGTLYGLLADRHSRDTLLLVTLYALLGHRFVRFPYYGPDTLARRAELRSQCLVEEENAAMREALAADAFGVGCALQRYRTRMAGEDVDFYGTAEFLYQVDAFPPYRYAADGAVVEARPGDHVIDCGACYGDTALFFAASVGADGQVLSFEPHPTISRLYLRNRDLNPQLAGRMTLVPAATGNTAGGTLPFSLCGPGSHLEHTKPGLRRVDIPITTIDAEMERRNWSRVDFIKMDVEGAELSTLQGAVQTLRRFRPRLAVCLYHKPEDFFLIPRFLVECDLGYRFYLEHHFMNNWETVLYAEPQ